MLLIESYQQNNCSHDLLFFFTDCQEIDKSSSETEWVNGRQNGCCMCFLYLYHVEPHAQYLQMKWFCSFGSRYADADMRQ